MCHNKTSIGLCERFCLLLRGIKAKQTPWIISDYSPAFNPIFVGLVGCIDGKTKKL